jgi:hypothetical protein
MQNYPNMSYCMYENTVLALQQILDDLQEAVQNNTSNESYRKGLCSRQEAESFDRIKYMCNCVLSSLEELELCESDDKDLNEFVVEDDEFVECK